MLLPRWVEVPLALVLLDYTLYIWHVLTHRVPWLWRFHVVHHIELDLDTSLDRAGGDERQLVERPDPLGLASWDAQIEYTAGRDYDWRAGVSPAGRSHPPEDARPAVQASATDMAVAR